MPAGEQYVVRLDLDDLRLALESLKRLVPRATAQSLRESMLVIQRDVQLNKLSGQYLGVVTGTARRSIQTAVEYSTAYARGRVGSPFRYVRAHELGFRGVVDVRGHSRRMRTRRGTRQVSVRPHSRKMNVRARHFLRDAVFSGLQQTSLRARRAIVLLAREGRVPDRARLRGPVS